MCKYFFTDKVILLIIVCDTFEIKNNLSFQYQKKEID